MLKCYQDEIEHIIAESPEDASAIQAVNRGDDASSPDEFSEVPMDKTLTIGFDESLDEFDGMTRVTKTIAEWITWNGRGVLCSTEW